MPQIRLYCSIILTFLLGSVCVAQELQIEWMAGGQYSYASQSAISPDGKYILTQNEDSLSYTRIINVWDARTLELKARIPGSNFRFMPDGNILIGLTLWDIGKNRVKAVLDSSGQFYSANPTYDQKHWVLYNPYSHFKIKDAANGLTVDSIEEHAEILLAGGVESTIIFKNYNSQQYFTYNFKTKTKEYDSVFSRDMAENNLTPLQFLSNGTYILARKDSLLRVYDISAHSFVYSIPTFNRSSRFVPLFSNDFSQFGLVFKDTLLIYNALLGVLERKVFFDVRKYGSWSGASFSKDIMVAGHSKGSPYDKVFKNMYMLWSLDSGEPIQPLTYTNGPVRAHWTRTGEHFVVEDFNCNCGFYRKTSNLSLWYRPSRRKVADIDTNVYEGFSLSPDDDLIAYYTEENKVVVRNYFSNKKIFEIDKRTDTNQIAAITLGADSILAIGYWIYDYNQTENIEIYNVYSGELLRTLPDSYDAYKIIFSKDRKYMAALCHHGARVWRTDTWENTLEKDDVPAYWKRDINFTDDNKYIIISDREGRHSIYDAVSGRWKTGVFPPPLDLQYSAVIGDVEMLPDGKHLISGYFDHSYSAPFYNRLYIWDVYTGKRTAVLDQLPPSIASISINRTGKILLGGHDGTITIAKPLDFPTGITYAAEPVNDLSAIAFPNPASSNITFEFLNEKPGFGQIEIFNTKGVLQKSFLKELFKEGETSFTVSTENLPAGVYYAKITNHETVQFVKFVVL